MSLSYQDITPVRSAHWYEDGNIYIQAGGKVHCVHRSILKAKSPIFADMFSLPAVESDSGKPAEGMSEGHPIKLPVDEQAFSDLLEWIYKIEWRPPVLSDLPDIQQQRLESFLENILSLAMMWEIVACRTYSVHFLEQLGLPASRRLELARKFCIDHWVNHAVLELLNTRLQDLRRSEILQIGFDSFIILAKAKEALEERRLTLADKAPAMGFIERYGCHNHDRCKHAWRQFWRASIGRKLLSSNNPLQYHNIMNALRTAESKSEWPSDIAGCCKIDMLSQLQEDNSFSVEGSVTSDITSRVVEKVKELIDTV